MKRTVAIFDLLLLAAAPLAANADPAAAPAPIPAKSEAAPAPARPTLPLSAAAAAPPPASPAPVTAPGPAAPAAAPADQDDNLRSGTDPFQSAVDPAALAFAERQLWKESTALDTDFRYADAFDADPALNAYLQRVMDRLFPEFHGQIRVKVIKNPVVNAFCMPDGTVYVHKAILALMENEAQLATLLAHEGSHFVMRHGYRMHRTAEITAGVNQFVQSVSPVIPTSTVPMFVAKDLVKRMTTLAATSSIYGFSRDMEREADQEGLRRMIKAGYDAAEAPKFFKLLAVEARANQEPEPFFFATHPRLEERINSYEEYLEENRVRGGDKREAALRRVVDPIRLGIVEDELKAGKMNAVIAHLKTPAVARLYPDEYHFVLGEAYRIRAGDDDLPRAATEYEIMIRLKPDYAPGYRALGVARFRQKNYPAAKEMLTKYLALQPAAPDRGFVDQYLAQIDQKLNGKKKWFW